jgi:hypothetical protein
MRIISRIILKKNDCGQAQQKECRLTLLEGRSMIAGSSKQIKKVRAKAVEKEKASYPRQKTGKTHNKK